jgi:hypothetical protein
MPSVTRHLYIRGLAGTASMLIGALALSASGGQSHYLAFSAALCTGGAVLTWVGFTGRRLDRIAWVVIALLAVAGLFLSLLVVREDVCCMFGYHRGLGYPWGWLDSSASADTMDVIDRYRADPGKLERTVDWPKVVFDGLFWWHAAVVAVLPATLVLRRAKRTAAGM